MRTRKCAQQTKKEIQIYIKEHSLTFHVRWPTRASAVAGTTTASSDTTSNCQRIQNTKTWGQQLFGQQWIGGRKATVFVVVIVQAASTQRTTGRQRHQIHQVIMVTLAIAGRTIRQNICGV